MKKLLSIGLFVLLLYHTLAYVLVCIGAWWQAEHDLSQRLLVYRSVDSMVEFEVPLRDKPDAGALENTTSEGFTYRGHYYSVVSLEVRGDTLHIAGLESESRSFWQGDLLSFLNKHVAGATDTGRKAGQFLKFLLKEYWPTPRTQFQFNFPHWQQAVQMPDVQFVVSVRALPVHSPPPEV